MATPQLLAAFGIKASDVNPDADILTMRPGLSGISDMQLNYGNGNGNGNGPAAAPAAQVTGQPASRARRANAWPTR